MKFLRRHPIGSVFCAAVVLRLLFMLFFISSPFRFFHTVPGLDMQTLLNFGEWGTPGNTFFLTLHRLQTFIFWKLNSGTHPVMWHVLFQALLGAADAVMLSGIMLKLTGKKSLAAAAGILWALNPIELMYEFTTLQDSLVNFGIILIFYSFLAARKYHFRPLYALGAGAVTGIFTTGRPVAVGLALVLCSWCVWYVFRRRLPLKRAACFCAGLLTLWMIFACINLAVGKHFSCFFNPVSYALSVNSSSHGENTVSSAPIRTSVIKKLFHTSGKMFCRIPRLWDPVELPENLNIYYLRQKLPLLKLPFEFVMIFAAAGVIMMLAGGKWKKREGLMLIPIISLAFFLCIREPIGRYRLMLLPWFIMLGVWLVQYAVKSRKRSVVTVILLLAMMFPALSAPRPLRASDFAAWGWALEGEAGRITEDSIKHFISAWHCRPDTGSAVNVITRAIRTNNRQLAENIAAEWVKVSNSSSIACYYAAIAAMPVCKKMGMFLRSVRPEELPPRLRVRYYIMQGDVFRSSGKNAEAVKNYTAAMNLPECPTAMKRYAERFIKTNINYQGK